RRRLARGARRRGRCAPNRRGGFSGGSTYNVVTVLFRIFCVVLVLASAAACRPPVDATKETPTKLTPAEIAAKHTRAIVSIKTPKALGTGFIVHKNGLIATNLHVVFGGGAEILVTLSDKREFPVVEVMSGSKKH